MSRHSATTDYISYIYALSVIGGGVAGYAKAGSMPSLAAGLLFGSLAAYSAYQTSQRPRDVLLGIATAGTLLGFMGFRFYNSGKFMPAGLVALLSLGQVARLGMRTLGN